MVENLSVGIECKLHATLEVNSNFAADLKAECFLGVHSSPNMTVSEPLMDSTVKEVKSLGLIDKGQCELTIRPDESMFYPSEAVNVVCDMDNRLQAKIKVLHCYLLHECI